MRNWLRSLRSHPRIALGGLAAWVVEESFSHRFFGWLNDWIDQHAEEPTIIVVSFLEWIASNPLGITGLGIIIVLTILFVHSYVTATWGKDAGGRFARYAAVLTTVAIGVLLMSPLTWNLAQVSRVAVVFLICGSVGVVLNEGILSRTTALAQNFVTPIENLARGLDNLGNWVLHPPKVIGEQTSVTVTGPTSGTVIGKKTEVIVGPGATGKIIGSQTRVIVGGEPDPKLVALANDLHQAASFVRSGKGSRQLISPLINQSKEVPNAALGPVIAEVERALAASGLN